MKRTWFYAVIGTGALILLFWLQRTRPEPILDVHDLRALEARLDKDPSNVGLHVDVAVAYGAFAWESGGFVRALRRSEVLLSEHPEFGARADVRETKRQLAESMNRHLRIRGVRGLAGLSELMGKGREEVRAVLNRPDLSASSRKACAIALARIELCRGRPQLALDAITDVDAVGLEGLCRADALADLKRYGEAQKVIVGARARIEKWPRQVDPLYIKMLNPTVNFCGPGAMPHDWIKATRSTRAYLLGAISNELAALQGVERMNRSGAPLP